MITSNYMGILPETHPLWQLGFWNPLAYELSVEAHEAARRFIDYDGLGGNGNALELAAEYFDFKPDLE